MTSSAQHQNRPTLPTPEEIAALPENGGGQWNRLIFEQSPYLLQHAANPVDWYPWGEAAFDRARREGKAVFLSIGYATCHWCHVMEHESFEDPEVARLMNDTFVCIKVDREERPDIDHVYMTVTQALTGSGGWPMTVVMTPDKKPFFAGTYFPRESRYGRPGMLDLVPHLGRLWREDRRRADEAAEQITTELSHLSGNFSGGEIGAGTLEKAYRGNVNSFDSVHGGFGHRPKFPVPHNLMWLLRYHERSKMEEALHMVEVTLDNMRRGGIYDHVGFGFHRYSTDEEWLLPHFEKMLYDQALMAMAYTEAYQVTGKPLYRQTAGEILTYVLRDMTSPEGGFYSAEDADAEGEEGKFTVWAHQEVLEILGEEEGRLYCDVYTITPAGNFRDESTGRATGLNIPHLRAPFSELAAKSGMEEGELLRRLETSRRKLFAVRERRIHPLKDDKILTDWNGLMIAAFAKAAKVLGESRHADAARRAADFVLANLRTADGRLLKRFRNGIAGLPAHLEDYAFLCWGLIELYEATFEIDYLSSARHLAGLMVRHFGDAQEGGFFLTADDGEQLLVRSKDIFDGAIPSGNSVAAYVLLRLGRMTGSESDLKWAEGIFEAFSAIVSNSPSNFSMLMNALDLSAGPTSEIVLAGDAVDDMAVVARRRFVPRSILLHRPDTAPERAVTLSPFLKDKMSCAGRPTAFVCEDYACRQPVHSAAELDRLLH